MAHFYGQIWGNRGNAHRLGTKNSGINARLKSWDNEVYCRLCPDKEGKDLLRLSLPVGMKVVINDKEVM